MDDTVELVRHLLEYTLRVHCGGNQTELARRLQVEPRKIYETRAKLAEGKTSTTMPEYLLRMFLREELSLDEAMCSYGKELPVKAPAFKKDLQPCAYDVYTKRMSERYERAQEKKAIYDLEYSLTVHSHTFSQHLYRLFCKKSKAEETECFFCSSINDFMECPCKVYSLFIDQLFDVIDNHFMAGTIPENKHSTDDDNSSVCAD